MFRLSLLGALFLCAFSHANAQLFSFGVKGGVPLTDAYSTITTSDSVGSAYKRLYLVGPTAEIHLPFHLSIEVDALYRRNGFSERDVTPFFASAPTAVSVNDWQFPILAKAELHEGLLRPFIDGGLVYRHISANSFAPDKANTAGIAFGAGLTIKVLLIRISPEIRYTYWPTQPITLANTTSISSSNNQADFLLGITF